MRFSDFPFYVIDPLRGGLVPISKIMSNPTFITHEDKIYIVVGRTVEKQGLEDSYYFEDYLVVIDLKDYNQYKDTGIVFSGPTYFVIEKNATEIEDSNLNDLLKIILD